MITTQQLKDAMKHAAGTPGYTVEGSIESGKVRISYDRPNGLEFGTGLQSSTTCLIKGARKWEVYRRLI